VKEGNEQNVANTCWAAVVSGLLGRNGELIRTCWNAALKLSSTMLSAEGLRQLHEIELCVQIEGSEELKSSMLPMPMELRAAVDEAVANSAQVTSRAQSEVSGVLTDIGFKHDVS
jgi:hypothetical protein